MDNLLLLLLIIKSFLVVLLILYKKFFLIDNLVFPILSTIIVGIYGLIYFICKSQYKDINKINLIHLILYSGIVFIVIIMSFKIIKKCENPALMRAFIGFEIILLTLYVLIYNNYKLKNNEIIGSILIILGLLIITKN